jgi:hypothetical protein
VRKFLTKLTAERPAGKKPPGKEKCPAKLQGTLPFQVQVLLNQEF